MKLINIDGMPNFEVKTEDGKEYVLLPFKHLYDIPTVPAIPLDKVKQAIEEIRDCSWSETIDNADVFMGKEKINLVRLDVVLKILDKLISESEE
jgi:hypothetical protein